MKQMYSYLRGWPIAALFFVMAIRPLVRAQAPAWQTAVGPSQAASGFSNATAVAAGAAGNVYIVGAFRGTVQFGSTTLTSGPSNGIEGFVAKWNSVTGFAWAEQFGGGPSGFFVRGLAVQGTGVFVVGTFTGTTRLGNVNLTSAGAGDAYVAKFVDAGTSASFSWAQQAGGTGDDAAQALAVSGTSVYITGYFSGTQANFGAARLSSVGGLDLYVAKLTDAGTSAGFAWAQAAGGPSDDFSQAVAVSGSSVYLAGSSSSATASFGSNTLTIAGLSDVVVAKLTDAGNTGSFVWAQRAGGVQNDRAVAIEANGTAVYVAGTFESTASFGGTVLTNATPVGSIATDVFVTKITDAGPSATFAWAQRAGGESDDFASDLALSGPNVYLVGRFNSATATFGNTVLTNVGYNGNSPDIFVTKLTDAGTAGAFAWAQQAGGAFTDVATGVAQDNNGLYVTGAVNPPASFGSQAITGLPNTSTVAYLAVLGGTTGLAVASPALLDRITVFPNPSRTTATVQLPPVPGAAMATITLLDALGRTARTATVALPAAGLRHNLDLTGLPAGLYAVRVSAGSNTASRRLVIK